MSAARKTVKTAKVVDGGPIMEILRDTFLLIGSIASEVLDGLRDLREEEAKQTALMERMAEVIAPTEEQRRLARLTLAQEARSFEPDLDDDLAPVRKLAG